MEKKQIIEKYCGEEIEITDIFPEKGKTQIVCKRKSFPERQFCYIVKNKKVVFANSRIKEV